MTAVVKLDWNPSAQRENQISPEDASYFSVGSARQPIK